MIERRYSKHKGKSWEGRTTTIEVNESKVGEPKEYQNQLSTSLSTTRERKADINMDLISVY